MDPITIGLIISQAISLLLHGFHLQSKFRCGNIGSCCQCIGDVDETIETSKTQNKIETDTTK